MTVPRRLYKYQPFTPWGVENLRRRAIWFSKPASFNDPFECQVGLDNELICAEELDARFNSFLASLVSESDRAEARRDYLTSGKPNQRYREFVAGFGDQYVKDYRQRALNNRGVACFSEVQDDILMWSHYGGGHRGFCLEFDTDTSSGPFSAAAPVRYQQEMLCLSPIDKGWFGKGENFEAMLTTKALCWAYEREWRVWREYPDSLLELPPGCITAVYFGVATPPEKKAQLAPMLAGSQAALFEFTQGRAGFSLEARPFAG